MNAKLDQEEHVNFSQLDDMPTIPVWLESHIKKEDKDCKDIRETKHICHVCEFALEQLRRSKIKLDSEISINRCADQFDQYRRSLYDFKTQEKLWVTPAFMESCDFWGDYPQDAIWCAIAMASDLLYKLTGQRIHGVSERFIQPGCVEWNRYNKRCANYYDNYVTHLEDVSCNRASSFDPNVSVSCEFDKLYLPGPIYEVLDIIVNGEKFTDFIVLDKNTLVRTDGKPWWPKNNLLRSPYQQKPLELVSKDKEPKWFEKIMTAKGKQYQPVTCLDSARSKFDDSSQVADWVLEMLVKNPDAFPKGRRGWIEGFFQDHGVTIFKSKDWDKDRWVVSKQEYDEFVDKNYVGCKYCEGMSPGQVCNRCNTKTLASIPGPDIPDWLLDLADKDGIVIERPETNSRNMLSDELCYWGYEDLANAIDCDLVVEEQLATCPYDCHNSCDNDFLLTDLDYDIENVKIFKIKNYAITTCCEDYAQDLTYYYEDFLHQCEYCEEPESFEIALQFLGSHHKFEDPQAGDEIFGFQKEPDWARQELGLEPKPYASFNDNVDEQQFAAWVAENLESEKNKEAKAYFTNWAAKELGVEPPPTYVRPTTTYVDYSEDFYEPEPWVDDPSAPAWIIRYLEGEPIEHSAQVAAAMLARNILPSLCGGNNCNMGLSLYRVTFDTAADYRFADPYKMLKEGLTGIPSVDLFIKACNPSKLSAPGYAFSTCVNSKKHRRMYDSRRGRNC